MMEHNQVTIRTYMVIRAERDAAIQERNMALNERKRAFAERDMAMLQRDAAIAERDSALQERDEAITSLQLRQSSMKDNYLNPGPPGNIMVHEVKHIPDQYEMGLATYISEAASGAREFPTSNPCQSHVAFEMKRSKNIKQKQEIDGVSLQLTKSSRMSGKSIGDLSKQASNSSSGGQKNEQNLVSDDEDVDGSWKDNLELNHIIFDESSMPVPVCSCTGLPQPCYKWGNGGWQSACCTTTISMYPLPHTSSKRHSRVAGRKMSGGVFTKLLNRLVAEGHGLSTSLDLKDHWGKHGTNGYVTQK